MKMPDALWGGPDISEKAPTLFMGGDLKLMKMPRHFLWGGPKMNENAPTLFVGGFKINECPDTFVWGGLK